MSQARPPRPRQNPLVLVRPAPLIFGAVAGLGLAVLLQQAAVTPLTTPLLLAMVLAGPVLLGVALPTVLLHARVEDPQDAASRQRARAVGVTVAVILALVVLVLVAVTAGMAQTGPGSDSEAGGDAENAGSQGSCSAIMNGEPVGERVVVPKNGSLEWELSSRSGNITAWSVLVHYAWFILPLDTGADIPPKDPVKRDVADLNEYPPYGVGVYRVSAEVLDENGDTCMGSALIVVPGNPLFTVLGSVAALLTLVGGVGGVVSAHTAARGERARSVSRRADRGNRGDGGDGGDQSAARSGTDDGPHQKQT